MHIRPSAQRCSRPTGRPDAVSFLRLWRRSTSAPVAVAPIACGAAPRGRLDSRGVVLSPPSLGYPDAC